MRLLFLPAPHHHVRVLRFTLVVLAVSPVGPFSHKLTYVFRTAFFQLTAEFPQGFLHLARIIVVFVFAVGAKASVFGNVNKNDGKFQIGKRVLQSSAAQLPGRALGSSLFMMDGIEILYFGNACLGNQIADCLHALRLAGDDAANRTLLSACYVKKFMRLGIFRSINDTRACGIGNRSVWRYFLQNMPFQGDRRFFNKSPTNG